MIKTIFRWAILISALMFAAGALAGDGTPAKQLFGAVKLPTADPTQSLGFYAKGCITGAVAIPMDGPGWQVIHPSRNRRWGNPAMISLLERLAHDASTKDGWRGIMIGDVSQPRGGPMLTGHASHQIGLDADIWLTPMPDHTMSYQERESVPEISMLRKDSLYVDPNVWTPAHGKLIMQAASYPEVERIFVAPGIKKKLCDTWAGDPNILGKVRPYYGHFYHFHIRIKCPPGSRECKAQAPVRDGSGCGQELAYWLGPKPWANPVKPAHPVKPVKPRQIMLSDLPKACSMVLNESPVSSMAAATYGATDKVAAAAFTEEPEAAPVVMRGVDDFSIYIPTGNIPLPKPRPMQQ